MANASHTRERAFAKEQRAADDGDDRSDCADEAGVGDGRAGQRDVERADVHREGEAGEDQQSGGRPEFGAAAPSALRQFRPRRQRRHGERHAPSSTGERSDIEKVGQHARPGGDRGPDDERGTAGAVDIRTGLGEGVFNTQADGHIAARIAG